MRSYLIIALLLCSKAYGQNLTVSREGERLRSIYLAMNVERLWIAGTHVNWQTGLPDDPGARSGVRTHCSAFVAAACQKLDVYILRPPQHGQVLLANAQATWLHSPDAETAGWKQLPVRDSSSYLQIQRMANNGKIIVAISKNPDSKKPGHTALVVPGIWPIALINSEGPEVIMAGTRNYNNITLLKGFHSHILSWPSREVEFFVHDGAK